MTQTWRSTIKCHGAEGALMTVEVKVDRRKRKIVTPTKTIQPDKTQRDPPHDKFKQDPKENKIQSQHLTQLIQSSKTL